MAWSALQLQWRQVTGSSNSHSQRQQQPQQQQQQAKPHRVILLPAAPCRRGAGQNEPSHNNLILLCFNFMKKFQVFSHTHTAYRRTHSHAVTPLSTRANALLNPLSLFLSSPSSLALIKFLILQLKLI